MIFQGPLFDLSGTITLGGTAQTIRAANNSRHYLILQNVSDTTMWVNFGVVAVADSPSLQLTAGGVLTFEAEFVPNSYISVIGATTGKKFVCKEG